MKKTKIVLVALSPIFFIGSLTLLTSCKNESVSETSKSSVSLSSPSSQSDDEKSSKTVKENKKVTTKSDKTAFAKADEITKPNPPISQETIERLEGKTQKKASDETRPNPPLSQDAIDKINGQGQNSSQGGTKHQLQVTQQVQRAWNTCAPTTVSMMLSARGVTASQEELAQAMGTDDSFGTHNADAIRVLNRYLFGYEQPTGNQAGYRLATVTTADLNSEEMRVFKERLKQNIADGYPMYYTFDNARIYPGSSGEHNVIGTGYQLTEDGSDIAYLYYIDPSYTQQDSTYGGLKKITPQELFHAMLTCVEPNYGW
ncbi:C39 family peptidase [Streptococcus merionis]|uniref:C39 family peptidase n=1 Tax=Streptococcus merionis TaxID=400065 RepID=UPI003515CC39